MAMIHVNRNRETLGKFTDQEVADGLKSGRFLPGDLAWKEPMPAWQPLSTFTDLPEASEENPEPPPVADESPSGIEPAWERPDGCSLGGALETVRQIFSNPASTFKNLPAGGRMRRAFFYFLISSVLGSSLAISYDFLASSINPDAFLDRMEQFPPVQAEVRKLMELVGTQKAISTIFVSSMVAQPFFLMGWIFVVSLAAHFFLLLAGAAEKGYAGTFRALSYAFGTGFLLQVMPLVGVPLSWVAFLVFGGIALKEVHGTSLWRVALAFLLMLVLSCGGLMALGLVLGLMA